MNEESIADKYYNLLTSSSNKIAVLGSFIKEALSLEPLSTLDYQFIGRLVKLYGVDVVYEGILSLIMADFEQANTFSYMKNYFSVICKNIFLSRNNFQKVQDLTEIANRNCRKVYGS